MNQVRVFDGLAAVRCGDVLLTVWQRDATPVRVRELNHWTDTELSAAPGTLIQCQIIPASSGPPNSEARTAIIASYKKNGARFRRLIMAPIGDALWVNIVRTIVRGVVLVVGLSKAMTIASSESEALEEVRRHASPETPPLSELREALRALHKALPPLDQPPRSHNALV